MDEDLEERLNAAESHLAHQEATLTELSDVLAEQWRVIERLTEKVDRLQQDLGTLAHQQEVAKGPEAPPPHY